MFSRNEMLVSITMDQNTIYYKVNGKDYGFATLREAADAPSEVWDLLRKESASPDIERMQDIGNELKRHLLSPEIVQLLWRERGTGKRLHIVTDVLWIPWEILYLKEDPSSSGVFIGKAFRLSCWPASQREPSHLFRLQNALFTADHSEEQKMYADLKQLLPGQLITQGEAEREGNKPRWDSYDLIQIFAHLHTPSNVDQSYLEYGGKNIYSYHVNSLSLGEERPLIFMASCNSAQAGWSLGGTGGWANRFIEAGAGAFIGTWWEVSPSMLREFTRAFYEAFLSGQPISDAFHMARIQTWGEYGVNALAMRLYAAPLAVHRLRDQLGPRYETPEPDAPLKILRNTKNGTKLLIGTALALFIVGMFAALQAHRARESLLNLSELSYPLDHLIHLEITMGLRMISRGLGALFSDLGIVKAAAWLNLLVPIGWIFSRRFPGKRLMTLAALLWLCFVVMQTFLISVTIKAHNASPNREAATSQTISDRLAFLGKAWLVNDNPANERFRENIHGLLSLSLLSVLALFIHSLHWWHLWDKASCCFSLILLYLIFMQMPGAFAFAEWGLKYPMVQLTDHTDANHSHPDADKACCIFDVSAGSRQYAVWLRCPSANDSHAKIIDPDFKFCFEQVNRKPVSTWLYPCP